MTEENQRLGSYRVTWWQVDTAIAICLVALIFTGAPIIGKLTFASEVDHVIKKEVKAATDPLATRLDGIETKVSGISELVKEQVVASLASNICRYAVRRAKETDFDERSRLLDQISKMKSKYKEFTASDFNMNDC